MFSVILLLQVATARNTFVSSPFDNFRMECSKRAAAVDVSIKIVESVGAKRQDVVFDMSCEEVQELFPWINIPAGVAEIDREDCYYSATFDPLLDENTEYSCKRREYMAGIARLTGTRLQILCCRLRSRDEFNCSEVSFNKPIGHTKSTIIEYDNKLINAIRIDDKIYVVRFCDLAPRDIANIYGDTKKTLARQHVTTLKPYAKARDKGNSSLIESRATTLRHSTSLFGTASLKPVSLQISSSQSVIQHMVPLSETSNSAAKPEALKDQVSARIRSAKTGTVGKMHHEKTLTTTSNIFSTIRYPINQVETVRQITRFRQSETPRTSSNLNDLSKITFYDNDFPNSNERKFAIPAKMKISKADLPLKTATPDDFMFLQTSSSDGRHRTPIQTHRPHVDIRSSEDTDGNSWREASVETTVPKKETPMPNTYETTRSTVTNNTQISPSSLYDPALFYNTAAPNAPNKEKVLTFCTKDVALRDNRNMVIACGEEMDIWYPARCPQGADCFLSDDSTYRLCCMVFDG